MELISIPAGTQQIRVCHCCSTPRPVSLPSTHAPAPIRRAPWCACLTLLRRYRGCAYATLQRHVAVSVGIGRAYSLAHALNRWLWVECALRARGADPSLIRTHGTSPLRHTRAIRQRKLAAPGPGREIPRGSPPWGVREIARSAAASHFLLPRRVRALKAPTGHVVITTVIADLRGRRGPSL